MKYETHIQADVCIIGSGCGGGVAAKVLAEAGMDVVVIEEGGYNKAEDFTQREDEIYQKMYQHQGSLTTDDFGFTILQGKTIGGSSTVGWTTSLRTPEFVLDHWVRHHHLEGYSQKDLIPYFEIVERYLNIHQEPYERHNENNRIIMDGARALGYKAIATGRNVDGCIACGFCGLGCSYEVKLSVDRTYIPDAEKAGAKIFSRARAEKISLTANTKTVEGNFLSNETDDVTGTFTVTAPFVVVAGSAINTPVLLLKSKIANSSGRVGATLTFHPTTAVLGIYDRIIDPCYGIPQSAVCHEFVNYKNDLGGFFIEAVPVHPVLASMSLPEFGKTHWRFMEKFRHIAASIILIKDLDSRGKVSVNKDGRPRIRYSLGERDISYIKEGLGIATQMHFAVGATEVSTLHVRQTTFKSPEEISPKINSAAYGVNQIAMYTAHPLSSCRMGVDPKTSVVDPNGETHDVPGLYICDGSVLPSSLGVNPQHTIFAVAHKIVDSIVEKWG